MKKAIYRNGEKVKFTGKIQIIAGGTFHEYKVLSGPYTGELRYTQKAPVVFVPDVTELDKARTRANGRNDF